MVSGHLPGDPGRPRRRHGAAKRTTQHLEDPAASDEQGQPSRTCCGRRLPGELRTPPADARSVRTGTGASESCQPDLASLAASTAIPPFDHASVRSCSADVLCRWTCILRCDASHCAAQSSLTRRHQPVELRRAALRLQLIARLIVALATLLVCCPAASAL